MLSRQAGERSQQRRLALERDQVAHHAHHRGIQWNAKFLPDLRPCGRIGAEFLRVYAVADHHSLGGDPGKLRLGCGGDAEDAAHRGQPRCGLHQAQRLPVGQQIVMVPDHGATGELGSQRAPEKGWPAVGVDQFGAPLADQLRGAPGQQRGARRIGGHIVQGLAHERVASDGSKETGHTLSAQGCRQRAVTRQQHGQAVMVAQGRHEIEQHRLPAGNRGQRLKEE
jgi:hypothetical protein